ncbi:MAG: hypothetical protein ACYC1W_09655 [Gemmatimonadaceae bacterium]
MINTLPLVGGTGRDGRILSPSDALVRIGPVVRVRIRRVDSALGAAGPDFVDGRAFIDTGAPNSHLAPGVAAKLGLRVVCEEPTLNYFAGEVGDTPIYEPVLVDIVLGGAAPVTFRAETPQAAQNLEVGGFVALIARDLLSRCLLVYNGQTGLVSLVVYG